MSDDFITADISKAVRGFAEYDESYPDRVYSYLSSSEDALTVVHLQKLFCISQDTLNSWRDSYPEFDEAIKLGLEVGEARWRERLVMYAFEPAASVNTKLITLLSSNVYGISEEKKVKVSGGVTNRNLNIGSNMDAEEAAALYSRMIKGKD